LLTATRTTRARGLPVGSGTVERAWQHRVSARLTLAGMNWDMPGAAAVAVVRAWRKRDRRDDALRLSLRPRPPLRLFVPSCLRVRPAPAPAPSCLRVFV
jgi:hypothetical protein